MWGSAAQRRRDLGVVTPSLGAGAITNGLLGWVTVLRMRDMRQRIRFEVDHAPGHVSIPWLRSNSSASEWATPS